MAVDDLLPQKLPIQKPTSLTPKTPGELSISKAKATEIKKTSDRSGDYGLSFKDYNKKKKAELTATRAKLAEQRASASMESESRMNNLNTASQTVSNNTPEDQKPSGVSKFQPAIEAQTKKILTTVIPNLLVLAKDFAEKKIDLCPPPAVTKQTLETLNNIVKYINSSSDTIDKITQTSTGVALAANTIQKTSIALSTAIPVVSAAAKAIPLIPGIVVSALDDLDYINNLLLYKNDGSPRLPTIVAGVNSLTLAISVFSLNLKNAVAVAEAISLELQKCLPPYDQNKIEQFSAATKQYANYGVDNYNNLDRSSYKGFIIKIEEVPYTPTVNRRRAVGYTTNGIPLIQTELSFTTNSQTLVSELKLIIDRDNLKAY